MYLSLVFEISSRESRIVRPAYEILAVVVSHHIHGYDARGISCFLQHETDAPIKINQQCLIDNNEKSAAASELFLPNW
jgi:hypothetical protein